jgi:hypothetical protein
VASEKLGHDDLKLQRVEGEAWRAIATQNNSRRGYPHNIGLYVTASGAGIKRHAGPALGVCFELHKITQVWNREAGAIGFYWLLREKGSGRNLL